MNKAVKTFKEWYDSLTLQEKKDFRALFLKETGLSYPTFYSKITRSNFSLLEQKFIIEYVKQDLAFLPEVNHQSTTKTNSI